MPSVPTGWSQPFQAQPPHGVHICHSLLSAPRTKTSIGRPPTMRRLGRPPTHPEGHRAGSTQCPGRSTNRSARRYRPRRWRARMRVGARWRAPRSAPHRFGRVGLRDTARPRWPRRASMRPRARRAARKLQARPWRSWRRRVPWQFPGARCEFDPPTLAQESRTMRERHQSPAERSRLSSQRPVRIRHLGAVASHRAGRTVSTEPLAWQTPAAWIPLGGNERSRGALVAPSGHGASPRSSGAPGSAVPKACNKATASSARSMGTRR